MRKFLIEILWIFVLFIFSDCEEIKKYICPLNINNGYSSSFQEFRSNHFHAGMDLRTFRKTGFPVSAIADGKLVKIRMVKRGSGRGLYIKHHDGNTSIYFHLDRFNPTIETIVKKVQQERKKKYFGNYILKNPLTVKSGDIIAYSGETGYGFPHLHLEIRDDQYSAINPFKLINLPSRDRNYPVIRFLIFRNKSENLINGRIGENLIKFKKSSHGIYHLRQPVIVTGQFDFLLSARDISDSGKYVAPYEISIYIDDLNYYNLRFDRFTWEDNNQLGFVYDMFYSSPGNYCFNLFFQKGFDLEEKKIELDSVFDQLSWGKHECKIKVKDNYNNISTGYFNLYKLKMPHLEIENISIQKESIALDINNLEARNADRITVCLMDRQGNESFRGDLNQTEIYKPRNLILKGINEKVYFMDFLFIKKGIVYCRKRIRLKPNDFSISSDLDFTTFINRNEVFIKMKNPLLTVNDLVLNIRQGDISKTIKPNEGNDTIFFSFKPLSTEPDINLDFIIRGRNETLTSIQKKMRLVYIESQKKKNFRDGEFSAEFYPKAVNEPKVLKFETKQLPSQFPVLSRQISLYPYNFPFLDYVYFQFQKRTQNPIQAGIFKYSVKRKKWSYVYTHYDKTNHTFRTKVISSGIFALMRDIFPPVISLNKIRSRFLAKIKRVVITISDKGKGVNDETLNVWINNRLIDCEYDPDWRQVKIDTVQVLKRGKNSIRVRVEDYAGNRTLKDFSFFLK